ncbi:hypothetical protein Tco_0835100 [Tanacetum coccineum]
MGASIRTYWELLSKEILGATAQRDTGSYYPKRYWELLPKEIHGAITQRETGMSYGKMEIFTGNRFYPNKFSVVYEKTSPRSGLRWKPTSRIFENVGLRWIPIGNLLDSYMSKVDSEPPHGSNIDITNPHECKQTLDSSAGTSINVQKGQTLHLSVGTSIDRDKIKALIKENVIAGRPWSHGITLIKAKEISARPKSQGVQN